MPIQIAMERLGDGLRGVRLIFAGAMKIQDSIGKRLMSWFVSIMPANGLQLCPVGQFETQNYQLKIK